MISIYALTNTEDLIVDWQPNLFVNNVEVHHLYKSCDLYRVCYKLMEHQYILKLIISIKQRMLWHLLTKDLMKIMLM